MDDEPVQPSDMGTDGPGVASTKTDATDEPGSLPAGPVVLIADDDPEIRLLFRRVLERAGYAVIEAADGASALRAVRGAAVDLMLVDLQMSGIGGLEVIEVLRREPLTATLPIIVITGSGDDGSVVKALDCGADDFLTKPARMDEIVARVRARLRTDEAWSRTIEADLRTRALIVSALGRLPIDDDPVVFAAAAVDAMGRRSDLELAALFEVIDGEHLRALGTYVADAARGGGGEGGPGLHLAAVEELRLLTRLPSGPWAEAVSSSTVPETQVFVRHGLAAIAVAPIHSQDRLIGLLILGTSARLGPPSRTGLARVLGSAIDFATALGTAMRISFGARRDSEETRLRLRGVLSRRAFHPVFQPIVRLPAGEVVGHEALTRFDDGTPPADRFAEAAEAGIGFEYEIATIRAAMDASRGLVPGGFLTINVSPPLVVESVMLHDVLKAADRPIILEVTEHAVIEDYSALRSAMVRLPQVQYAVDDAGAGYSSFRHILELAPKYAKLDRTIIRGIERDPMRQALVAGLDHYAMRARCQLIAEGVETESEAATLAELGVELAQGYLFGAPARIA